jgi:sigma-54 dependent transcriptional regulator, acetoin dehydrogenase operon transcriptional activator AcoR
VIVINTRDDKINHMTNMLAATFRVDVGVISDDLCIIAGNDKYLDNLGLFVPDDSHAAAIMRSGEKKFVKDLQESTQCFKCGKKGTCPYIMGLYNPIIDGDVSRGVVCFVARNMKQRNIILRNRSQIDEYIQTMVSIITKQIIPHNTYDTDLILNCLYDGIIVVDSKGRILKFNQAAEVILSLSKRMIVGESIEQVLPKVCFRDLLINKEYGHRKPLEGLPYDITFQPIYSSQRPQEFIIHIHKASDGKYITIPNIARSENYWVSKMIGESEKFNLLKYQASRVSATNSTVLITGETGTGKELLAESIHNNSKRKNGPYITVNCSAIPENLIESELFGYTAGSFTGSKNEGHDGKFELADKGTIFLDEIGDLPLSLQAKLLRVLENKTIEKIGLGITKKIDTRVIAATNKNLKSMTKEGQFREDLYYRLNVVPLQTIPLRDNLDDILLLIEHYMNYFAANYDSIVEKLDVKIIETFKAYNWPGNVRELKNAIEYIINISNASIPSIESLPPEIYEFYHKSELKYSRNAIDVGIKKSNSYLSKEEVAKITDALKMYGNDTKGKAKAAEYLGISLATLYRKLRNIKPE